MQTLDGMASNDILISDYASISDTATEKLLDLDESLAKKFILNQPIAEKEYNTSFLFNIASCKLFPVFHGVALRNIGTEQLLNAITSYLPVNAATDQGDLCAFVYKIDRDEQMHKRAFARVFGGSLEIRDTVAVEGCEEPLKLKKTRKASKWKNCTGRVCFIWRYCCAFQHAKH